MYFPSWNWSYLIRFCSMILRSIITSSRDVEKQQHLREVNWLGQNEFGLMACMFSNLLLENTQLVAYIFVPSPSTWIFCNLASALLPLHLGNCHLKNTRVVFILTMLYHLCISSHCPLCDIPPLFLTDCHTKKAHLIWHCHSCPFSLSFYGPFP